MATTITPTIVTVNTTVTQAPSASQLQQSGAVVSTGGTTLASGSYQYCGTLADVTAILAAPLALTSLSYAAGTVTATTVGTLAVSTGETFVTTISGAVPAGYNGTYLATATGTDTFTYTLAADPGTETTPGTYTPPGADFVQDSATTFFAQGGSVGLYVLELGAQTDASTAITALGAWITANSSPQLFYAYLTPPPWDSQAAALNTLASDYSNPSGQTYFFVTTTTGNVSVYANTKSVFSVVPSPTSAKSEVQAAAMFYQWLVNNPGPSSRLSPMAYRYLYGVTPWVRQGNSTNIDTVLTAYGNLVLTGAEGGISTATQFKGTLMDGEQASWWYGVDWFRIQVQRALAAAILNGSNSQPPLLYDQAGINSLQAVAQNVANSAVSYGCAQSVTVSAEPFYTYVTANPSDYNAGIYNGLSATLVGQNGFLTITFNLDAVQFAA